jgi:hypothetical protein
MDQQCSTLYKQEIPLILLIVPSCKPFFQSLATLFSRTAAEHDEDDHDAESTPKPLSKSP